MELIKLNIKLFFLILITLKMLDYSSKNSGNVLCIYSVFKQNTIVYLKVAVVYLKERGRNENYTVVTFVRYTWSGKVLFKGRLWLIKVLYGNS